MGKPKAPLTPGRRRQREEMNKTLSAERALDRIESGVGDRLAEETATAVATVRARFIRKSESESRIGSQT